MARVNISLPSKFELSGNNVADKRRTSRQRLELYSLASDQQERDEKRKTALMLHTLGPEFLLIYNGFEFKKQAVNHVEVIGKFDGCFIPKKNTVYNQHTYILHRRPKKTM